MIHTGPNSKIVYTEKVKAKLNTLKFVLIFSSLVVPFVIYGVFHMNWVSSSTMLTIAPEISHAIAKVSNFDINGDYMGNGSAFLVSPTLLLTNKHVVEGVDSYIINFTEHPTLNEVDISAKVLYTPTGATSSSDYAVLSIERNDELIPLEFEDTEPIKAGDLIYAYGYPSIAGGEPAFSLTKGIISNCDTDPALMLIDCDIFPGNSGGPTINENGKVIGINTLAAMDEFQGQNFSLKIEHILEDQAIQSFDWSGEPSFEAGE